MYKQILTILVFLPIFSFAQGIEFLKQCSDFAKFVVGNDPSGEMKDYLDPSLINKETSVKIDSIRKAFEDEIGELQFHVVKLDREEIVFNVFIHDAKIEKKNGNLRILYDDLEDILIDQWKYLPEKGQSDEFFDEHSMPPPPPPPSMKTE